MKKICTFILVVFFVGGFVHGQTPSVNNIQLHRGTELGLDITHFGAYRVTADIDPNGRTINSVKLRVTPQNADALQPEPETETNWDFLTNGTPEPDPNVSLVYYMTNSLGNSWAFNELYPDDIYPEVFFAPSEVTHKERPSQTLINNRNYHLMHFQNPFTMGENTSFFIEFYATPVSLSGPPSVDLQVYLVGKGKSSDFFQSDWRNHPDVELAGTIDKDRAFHHTHSDSSKHYVVPLSTNSEGKIGSRGIDVSGDFWIVLYAPTQLATRGWNLKYHDGENNSTWYRGSASGFTVEPQTGRPDVHVHVARNAADLKDGVKLEVIVNYGDPAEELEEYKFEYFGEIPNLPPNASSFTAPAPGTYSGDVTISWLPATDPNNDDLTYYVKIVNASDKESVYAPAAGQGITGTSYELNTDVPELPNGSYDILVEAYDGEYRTGFYWSANVSEDDSFTIYNKATDATWTGATDTAWETPGNWNPANVPGVGSIVTIPSSLSRYPVLSGGATIQDLVIQAGASLVIGPEGSLTVTENLVNNAGADGLVIQSDDSGTGSLIHHTPNVPGTIKRHITGSSTLTEMHYKMVSVPLKMEAEPVSGLFLGSYLYQFNAVDQAWAAMGSSTTTILDVDQGYMIYYPNDAGITYSFAGPMNNGPFTMSVAYEGGGTKDNGSITGGFNLVPNPYPSALDWDATMGKKEDNDPWIKTNIDNTIWIWNPDPQVKNYAAYTSGAKTNDGSRFIPVGQSFFVRANAAGPALSVNNAARVHSGQAFFKDQNMQTDELLRIRAMANDYRDEAVVRFLEGASPEQDARFDAVKMFGADHAPQLYSQAADGKRLSIYSHPHPTENISIPLGFELQAAATAKLEFEGVASFDAQMQILLEDLLEQVVIDLRAENAYSFVHDPDNDPNRFLLHMQLQSLTGTEPMPEQMPVRVFAAGQQIHVHLPELDTPGADVEVIDLLGRVQQRHKMEAGTDAVLDAGAFRGVAIVRVVAGQQVFTKRVIIR